MSMIETIPVTVCPPGKRSRDIAERPRIGAIPITTATALRWPETPSIVPKARDDRRTAQERVEAAQRADAVSVALAQPHRAGSDDPRLAFPLGRFCARTWPRDPDFANAMHAAGSSYAADIRAVKVAKGFHHVACDSDNPRPTVSTDDASPEEIAALRATIFGLERTLERASGLLREIMARCPSAMERMCYDHADPSPYDEDMLRNGLYRLSLHYGHWERRRG